MNRGMVTVALGGFSREKQAICQGTRQLLLSPHPACQHIAISSPRVWIRLPIVMIEVSEPLGDRAFRQREDPRQSSYSFGT